MDTKDCIFCKIINKEIEAEVISETGKAVAFNDVNPQAPVHILIVPKEHKKNLNEADNSIIGECVGLARDIAGKMDIARDGYRIVINCNKNGGQEVGHLHVHLIGGRPMTWPPG